MLAAFDINYDLLRQAYTALSARDNLFWLVGGSGSGKTTICKAISTQFDMVVYDMDEHIYGAYHARFTSERYPVNTAWASAENGLAWLLNMSWEAFNNFNQAALPEYLDLLVDDIATIDPQRAILIDGGISNPALLTHALPATQIVCLSRPGLSSQAVWEESPERIGMKDFVYQLPHPEQAWQRFLEFDANITRTMLAESQQSNIVVCSRRETDAVDAFAHRVTAALGISSEADFEMSG